MSVNIEYIIENTKSELKTNICKKFAYFSVCISSCAVIILLIAGLMVGSRNGKDDQLSINLLISFAAIFGAMLLGGICCCIYISIDKLRYKDNTQNLNNGEICFVSGRQTMGV